MRVCACACLFMYIHTCACMYVLWIFIYWPIYYFFCFTNCVAVCFKNFKSHRSFSIFWVVYQVKITLSLTPYMASSSLCSPYLFLILFLWRHLPCRFLCWFLMSRNGWGERKWQRQGWSSSLGIVGWKNGWLFFCESTFRLCSWAIDSEGELVFHSFFGASYLLLIQRVCMYF